MTTGAEPVRIEDSAKRVRTYLGGELIADTVCPKLVWETPHHPVYYFPKSDVRMGLLTPSQHESSRSEASFFTVKGGSVMARDAAWYYPDPKLDELREMIRFDWDAMDAWFEEDEQIYVHGRDPHHRIDILNSSRHVQVVINGTLVANSHHPRLLFETGLPTRFYLPLVDVRMDLLRPSDTATRCPYKGTAHYWSMAVDGQLFEDVVWTYTTPLPESVKIAGLVSFYDERVELYVDGVLQDRPGTVAGRPILGGVLGSADRMLGKIIASARATSAANEAVVPARETVGTLEHSNQQIRALKPLLDETLVKSRRFGAKLRWLPLIPWSKERADA
ncbi:hypothetical protein GCM10009535_54360 [Streptomyces thermocarboxydovorans]|uniref:DUF427 domain-containing protein n=1 Tax=Streptomyces thermocarboxydovorans TaxID=59298 RepID=A0ABN1HUB0_9ACTN